MKKQQKQLDLPLCEYEEYEQTYESEFQPSIEECLDFLEEIQLDLPFYEYKKYEQNYESKFQSFLEKYPNADEESFLNYLELCYRSWFSKKGNSLINGIYIGKAVDHGEIVPHPTSLEEFVNCIISYFLLYKGCDYSFSQEAFAEVIDIAKEHRRESILKKIPTKSVTEHYCRRYILTKHHLKFSIFIKTDENGKIIPNTDKYADFLSHSIKRIVEDIERKRDDLKKTIPEKIVAQQYEIFDDAHDLTLKQRLIIIHKLGIIDFIKTIQIQPDNITHTANILASILGEKGGTVKSYLNPMLTEDINNTSNNNPYYRKENEEEAKRIINKLKIKSDKVNL